MGIPKKEMGLKFRYVVFLHNGVSFLDSCSQKLELITLKTVTRYSKLEQCLEIREKQYAMKAYLDFFTDPQFLDIRRNLACCCLLDRSSQIYPLRYIPDRECGDVISMGIREAMQDFLQPYDEESFLAVCIALTLLMLFLVHHIFMIMGDSGMLHDVSGYCEATLLIAVLLLP